MVVLIITVTFRGLYSLGTETAFDSLGEIEGGGQIDGRGKEHTANSRPRRSRLVPGLLVPGLRFRVTMGDSDEQPEEDGEA